MKGLISLLVLLPFIAFSAVKTPALESCFKSADELDREYCSKKRLRSISQIFEKDFKGFEKGISQSQKDQYLNSIKADLSNKEAMLKQLQAEINLKKSNLQKVSSLKSNEQIANEKKNSKKEKRKEKIKKVKKLFKKIF